MDSVIDFAKSAARVDSLNKSLELVGIALFVATAIVVIGLVFDCLDDFKQVWHAIKGCFKYKSLSRWKYLEHKVKLSFIGGALVTVGVAGELILQHVASGIESDLQTENGKLVAFLNGKANEARLEQERLRAENLKLEQLLQPRRLSAREQDEIRDALLTFGKRKLSVISGTQDPEAFRLCKQIVKPLRQARLEVDDSCGIAQSPGGDTGVSIVWWLTKDLAKGLEGTLNALECGV